MSTFVVGFSCVRSSPSLTTAVYSRGGPITGAKASRTAVAWIAGSGAARCFSLWPVCASPDARKKPSCPSGLLAPKPQWARSSPSPASTPRPPPPSAHSVCQRRTLFGRQSQNVVTEYIHLPENYNDEQGLPFRRHGDELGLAETIRIFPGMADMTPGRATKLLEILHGRRVAGTLDDPSLRINTSMYSQREIDKALEYLRSQVPVDEILNAGLRAEDELLALETEALAQENDSESQTSTAEASKDDDTTTIAAAESNKEDAQPHSVYGESILDRIRAANIARREAAERAEAAQRRKEEEAAAQNWGGLAAYDPALHRGLHPQQLAHYEAATSDLAAPPDTPRWRVLLPTTAFVAALLAALYLVVAYLAPPQPQPQPQTTPSSSSPAVTLTVGALVLLNVGVFIAWKRVRLWRFLNRHFILDFVAPRPHQILTALTTHQDPRHLLKTMLTLCVGGSLLIPEVGPVPFVATYVASGVCGFLATMYTHVARGMLVYMFGASSAGFGVVCAYFWLYRFDGFKILGLPPDPFQGVQGLGIIGLLISLFALVPMVRRQGGNVDWMSHLVGMLTGIGCASLMDDPWRAQKILQESEERRTKDTK